MIPDKEIEKLLKALAAAPEAPSIPKKSVN
jgi:hypothetical protein